MEKIATFKIMHFTITGGEPLEHANFFEILKKSIELFPIVEVFSNGQDLTEETIRKVSIYFRKADFFQISLDGMRDAYKIQRGVDSFDKVIANIKLMKKYDINIRLHMTVTDINVNDIISVYNLANKLKVNVFSITPVYDLRRGKQFRNIELLDQYEKTIKYLRELNSTDDSNVILRIFMPLEIKSKTAKYVKESRKEYLFFNDNVLHWTIDAEGNIYNFMDHYIYKDLYIGNIYDDSILELTKRNYIVQQKIGLRNLSDCKCAHCSNVRRCKGGNYINNYPNINSSDERCVFNG